MAQLTVEEVEVMLKEAGTINDFYKQIERLMFSDKPDRELDLDLANLAHDLAHKKERLDNLASRVMRTAGDVQSRINRKNYEYTGINSLGELQGLGTEFDIACAMYAEAFERFSNALARRRQEEVHAALKRRVNARLQYTTERVILELLYNDNWQTIRQLEKAAGVKAAIPVREAVDHLLSEDLLTPNGAKVEKYGLANGVWEVLREVL